MVTTGTAGTGAQTKPGAALREVPAQSRCSPVLSLGTSISSEAPKVLLVPPICRCCLGQVELPSFLGSLCCNSAG